MAVCELGRSRLLLMNDRAFPWLIVVPREPGLVEWHDLPAPLQDAVQHEVMAVARSLKSLAQADKINIGALGNLVPQLHIHVVARKRTDRAWPGPVWGSGPAVPYGEGEAEPLLRQLRASLGDG